MHAIYAGTEVRERSCAGTRGRDVDISGHLPRMLQGTKGVLVALFYATFSNRQPVNNGLAYNAHASLGAFHQTLRTRTKKRAPRRRPLDQVNKTRAIETPTNVPLDQVIHHIVVASPARSRPHAFLPLSRHGVASEQLCPEVPNPYAALRQHSRPRPCGR